MTTKFLTIDDANATSGAHHAYVIQKPNGYRIGIFFQDGIISEVGYNGVTIEDLLSVTAHRLQGFQDGPFNDPDNQLALDHINAALNALNDRTAKRIKRGVEGTHQK